MEAQPQFWQEVEGGWGSKRGEPPQETKHKVCVCVCVCLGISAASRSSCNFHKWIRDVCLLLYQQLLSCLTDASVNGPHTKFTSVLFLALLEFPKKMCRGCVGFCVLDHFPEQKAGTQRVWQHVDQLKTDEGFLRKLAGSPVHLQESSRPRTKTGQGFSLKVSTAPEKL